MAYLSVQIRGNARFLSGSKNWQICTPIGAVNFEAIEWGGFSGKSIEN